MNSLNMSIDSDVPQYPSTTTNTTTIVGVAYDDGVILGSTNTITQLTSSIFSCHSSPEIETLLKDAPNFIFDDETNTMVAAETIGTMLSAYNANNTNMLQTGVIIGGGRKIYEISLGGIVMEKSNFVVGGYGVAYLNNYLEKKWKKGMNEEEAEKLVLKALSLNVSLGGTVIGSNCGVQTASVNSKGITRCFHSYDNDNDTLSVISREELDVQHLDVPALLECARARLIFLLQDQ